MSELRCVMCRQKADDGSIAEIDAKLKTCLAFISEWADLDKCCCHSPAIISCFKCEARELFKELGE